ncbi:hypothetical protein J2T12_001176 [Paenibacillus anaericanus]|uniref:hypothetical protein n=1 Tax=Paenibacillus anaericanus TaxID=170367 RepID=UPI00277DACCB|nr:hypothetical protein [Paenibacillus anaericanus]MDQ0087770.1 hypothetical protein [Paenibacillus anaericanus]
MFNNIKSILWLLCSVSFCIGALLYTTYSISIQGAVKDGLVPFTQIQKRSVVTGSEEIVPEKYSGLQILFSLRSFHTLGAVVEVDGRLLEVENREEDNLVAPPIIREPSILDLDAEYKVSFLYSDVGRLNKITFHRK